MAETIYYDFVITWKESDENKFDEFINERIEAPTDFFNPFKPDQFIGTLMPPSQVNKPVYVQKVYLIAQATTRKYFEEWGFKKPENNELVQKKIVINLTDAPGGNQWNPGFTPRDKSGWVDLNISMKKPERENGTEFTLPGSTTNEDLKTERHKQLLQTLVHEIFHTIQLAYAPAPGLIEEHKRAFMEGTALIITDRLANTQQVFTAQQAFGAIVEFLGENPHRNSSNPLLLERLSYTLWAYLSNNKNPNITRDQTAHNIKAMLERISIYGWEFSSFMQAIREGVTQSAWFGNLDQFSYFDQDKTNAFSRDAQWSFYMIAALLAKDLSFTSTHPSPLNDMPPLDDSETEERLKFRAESRNFEELRANETNTLLPYSFGFYRSDTGRRITISADNDEVFITNFQVNINENGSRSVIEYLEFFQGKSFTKTFPDRPNSPFNLMVVGTRKKSVTVRIQEEEISAQVPDIHITRWNSHKGKAFEINPLGFSWAWASPDIKVGSRERARQTVIYSGKDNPISVRLRNKGNATARDISVEFFYQEASPVLSEKKWKPLLNKAGKTQTLRHLTLDPGQEKWFEPVFFCPKILKEDSNTQSEHFAFKVKVHVPDDPDVYNKTAIHNLIRINDFSSKKSISLPFNYNTQHDFGRIIIALHGKQYNLHNRRFAVPETGHLTTSLLKTESTLLPVPDRSIMRPFTLVKRVNPSLKKWINENEAFYNPNEYYFPLTEGSYPENVNASNLITLYHLIDDRLVGGMSIEITSDQLFF